MRLNGCLMQLSALFFIAFITLFGSLILLGPTIGNVFDNVLEEFDTEQPLPTIAIITVAPSATPFPTQTLTDTSEPTATSIPTDTATLEPTETSTPEPTETPTSTDTFTPEPTETPTSTETFTSTPTETETPTSTATFTPTPTETATNTATATDIPTSTFTPSPVPTAVLCQIQNTREVRVNVRAAPASASTIITQLATNASVEVIGSIDDTNGFTWYEVFLPLDDRIYTQVEANIEGEFIHGWIREDVVTIISDGGCAS